MNFRRALQRAINNEIERGESLSYRQSAGGFECDDYDEEYMGGQILGGAFKFAGYKKMNLKGMSPDEKAEYIADYLTTKFKGSVNNPLGSTRDEAREKLINLYNPTITGKNNFLVMSAFYDAFNKIIRGKEPLAVAKKEAYAKLIDRVTMGALEEYEGEGRTTAAKPFPTPVQREKPFIHMFPIVNYDGKTRNAVETAYGLSVADDKNAHFNDAQIREATRKKFYSMKNGKTKKYPAGHDYAGESVLKPSMYNKFVFGEEHFTPEESVQLVADVYNKIEKSNNRMRKKYTPPAKRPRAARKPRAKQAPKKKKE